MLAKAHKGLLAITLIALTMTTPLLEVTAANNRSLRTVTPTLAASNQQPGGARAPESIPAVKWTYTIGYHASTPSVGDVDGDNKLEIVVESFEVYCLSGTGGVKWIGLGGGYGHSCAAIGDVDGDGRQEIVVAAGWQDRLYCLNGSGGVKWNDTTGDLFVESSPAIADIDKDGKAEIIVGSEYVTFANGSAPLAPKIYCFNGSGGVKWRYVTGDSVVSRPTAADVDGDDKIEVIVGSGDGKVYSLNATGGSMWNYTTGAAIWCSPVVADVDGDGKQEILVTSTDSWVYCLSGNGGLKWRYWAGDSVYSSPAVADVDGDGKPEIVVTASDGKFYCLNGSGAPEWSYTAETPIYSSPTVADVDGDNKLEIIAGSASLYSQGTWKYGQAIYCLNGTGGLKWAYNTGDDIYSTAVVADVDGDNKTEIVVTTDWKGKVYCLDAFPSEAAFKLSSALFVGAGLLVAFVVIVAVIATGGRSGRRIGRNGAKVNRKDKLLDKLGNEELLELARSVSQVPLDPNESRDDLTNIVKGQLSIEEIKEKVNRIRAASSQ